MLSDKNSVARARALRETAIVLAITLLPLALGAFLAWVRDRLEPPGYESLQHYVQQAMLSGQLFLAFLSLAGSNFARLWDPQATRISFSGFINIFHLLGATLTAGLIGLDPGMSKFSFFPIDVLSVIFMAVAIVHYFILAVPTYIEKPDPPGTARKRGAKLAADLRKAQAAE